MEEDQLSIDETTLTLELSEATDAVKDGSFEHALNLLKVILKDHPDHIDSLYLAAVSSRYLKNFDESKKFIERLMIIAPDMGRAYQELGHIFRDMKKIDKAVIHYRQACELNPALIGSWSFLYKYFIKNKNEPAAEHAAEQLKNYSLFLVPFYT